MYLFIATIFIAQLIIAGTVLVFIIKADKKVCLINDEVIKFMPSLEINLREAYDIVRNLKKTLYSILCIIGRKKQIFKLKLIKTFILYAILICCKGKFKRSASVFNMLVLIKEYIDKIPFNSCKSK